MWVANNDKERVKTYLKSDIESNITNIMDVSNRIHDSIAAVNRAAAGIASGTDRRLIDDCQRALQGLSEALQGLYACRNILDSLETREWADDE